MDTTTQILNSITLLSVTKVLIVTLLLVYGVFSFLIMRMIGSMTKAVQMKDEHIIKLLGSAHFVFAILVLVLALVVL